jgi:hypothetical protein
MRDEVHAAKILEATVKAVKLPVTLKMRTGWDEQNRNAPNLARIAESCGIKMLTVHGRTRCQFYDGRPTTVCRVEGRHRPRSLSRRHRQSSVDRHSPNRAPTEQRSDGAPIRPCSQPVIHYRAPASGWPIRRATNTPSYADTETDVAALWRGNRVRMACKHPAGIWVCPRLPPRASVNVSLMRTRFAPAGRSSSPSISGCPGWPFTLKRTAALAKPDCDPGSAVRSRGGG